MPPSSNIGVAPREPDLLQVGLVAVYTLPEGWLEGSSGFIECQGLVLSTSA